MIRNYIENTRINIIYRIYGIEGIVRYLERAPSSHITSTLQRHGARIGEGTYAQGPLLIENSFGAQDSTGDFSRFTTGKNCYIGKNVRIDLAANLTLGDEVILAGGCVVLTHQDCGRRYMSKFYPRRAEKVTIGFGSLIGTNAIILVGVQVGEGSVVGVGSVVTQDVPSHTLVAGSPAVVKRSLL